MRQVSGNLLLAFLLPLCLLAFPLTAGADTAKEMRSAAQAALDDLYRNTPGAKELRKNAKAILVFPRIIKGGFLVGGQYGEGVLFVNGKASGYYNSAAASYGLQAGIQKFGYALFFMSDSALAYFKKSSGWEIGAGPNVTIVDEGVARSISTTTARDDVYAFFFSQKGLMAGLGLQGTKISRIEPSRG